jgi:hypothetical protein
MAKPASGTTVNGGHALATGLAAAWGFLENSGSSSADSTGNGHTLTLDASVTWSTDGNGDICISAPNDTTRVAAVASTITLPGNQPWSIAWRSKQTTSGLNGMVLGNDTNQTDFIWMRGTSYLRFRPGDSTGADDLDFSPTVFTADHDYLMVYNGSTQMHLYKDGAEVASSPITLPTSGHGDISVQSVGSGYSGDSFCLIGTMTYCYVWSNRALTSSDATTLHGTPYAFFGTSLTLTAPVSYQTFQRTGDSNGIGGTASISIAGTYSGSPSGSIEASFNGGAYATIVATPSGGTYSGTLTGQAAGQGTLTVRFTGDHSISAAVTNVGVGDVVLCSGQSNMSGRGTNNQSYKDAVGLKACLFGNDYTWKQLVDPYDSNASQVDTVSSDSGAAGSFVPLLATLWMAYTKAPVAFIPAALGGTSITQWAPGSNHLDRTTLYGSANYRTSSNGANGGTPRVNLWWQGETDAQNSMAQATYLADYQSYASAVKADIGCKTMPCKLLNCSGPAPTDLAHINAAIGQAWSSDNNTITGPDLSDIASDDTFHAQTDAKLQVVAARWWNSVLRYLFGVGGGLRRGDFNAGFNG